MKVWWSARARRDLLAIHAFIARDKPSAALQWVAKLRAQAKAAAIAPAAGRMVPEIGRAEIREVFLKTYRIVYRKVDGGIEVLTVFEGSRLLPDDLGRQG